jgi:hypothetical protein
VTLEAGLRAAAWAAATILLAASALAQHAPPAPPPAPHDASAAPAWEFSLSGYGYFIPDENDYGSAVATADREALHLEGRYNYENLNTASLWVGMNFEFGEEEKVHGDVTPMLGGVFGHTNGVAPGFHFTLAYKRFELYSEGEYLFDTDAHTDSYFYNWNELSYGPLEWLRAGLVSQRTRAYRTPLDIQRGFFIRATHKSWTFSVYVFNAGWTDPTVVAAVAVEF